MFYITSSVDRRAWHFMLLMARNTHKHNETCDMRITSVEHLIRPHYPRQQDGDHLSSARILASHFRPICWFCNGMIAASRALKLPVILLFTYINTVV